MRPLNKTLLAFMIMGASFVGKANAQTGNRATLSEPVIDYNQIKGNPSVLIDTAQIENAFGSSLMDIKPIKGPRDKNYGLITTNDTTGNVVKEKTYVVLLDKEGKATRTVAWQENYFENGIPKLTLNCAESLYNPATKKYSYNISINKIENDSRAFETNLSHDKKAQDIVASLGKNDLSNAIYDLDRALGSQTYQDVPTRFTQVSELTRALKDKEIDSRKMNSFKENNVVSDKNVPVKPSNTTAAIGTP